MSLPPRRSPVIDWDAIVSARGRGMASSAIREILAVTERPDVLSFAGGLPAPELFPLDEVRAAADRVLVRDGAAALQYSTTQGHRPLREWIAAADGVGADHVQVVTGSQQALDLLGKVLLDEGDGLVVESPTYLGALQAMAPYGPRLLTVPMDEEGMDTAALAALLEREAGGPGRAASAAERPVRALYAIPNFQNPTGRSLSLRRRRELVEITARHGVVVLEDDPYGALRFSGDALPSVFSLGLEHAGGDPDANHVVRVSSFSKTLVPGLRDGWVSAARPLIDRLVRAKQAADLHTPTLNQLVVTELLEVLPRQVEIVRRAYGERAAAMGEALDAHLPAGSRRSRPDGGMFVWVELPDDADPARPGPDAEALLGRAVERGVAFVPGRPFHPAGDGARTLRLSFSCATPDEIAAGVATLGEVLAG